MIIISLCVFFMGQVEDAVRMRQYGLAGTQEILQISDDYYYKIAFIEQARNDRELTVELRDNVIHLAGVKAFNECLIREGL